MPSVRRLPLAVATALFVAVAVPPRSLRAQDPGLPPVPALLGAKPAVAAPMAAAKAAPQREWIVVLRDPPQFDQPFDVRHRGLAPAASAALRQEEIAQATARYHAACAPLAVVLEGLGAADVRHFPLLGMFACRLGDGEASALAAWRCVGSVTPAMSVKPQRRVVRASDPDVIQPNHHAAVVAHRAGWTGANGSSLLAILDAWISVTDDGAGYTTHQMFRQGSVPNAASRIVASWNIPASQPLPPAPTAQGLPYNMDHGLGMAAVAAGAACAIPEPLPFADGQAPAASLVDINIVRPVPPATASCFDAPPSPGAAPQSVTDAYGCYAQDTDILAALNLLPTIVLSNTTRWVRIANLSYGGSTNPNHALPTAIDALAANWDILVVTPAGNYGNPSVPFESINACNGLAVGSTMRTPASGSTPAHPANAYSGRGPLLRSNTFPPCAIGAEYWAQYFTTVQGGQVTPFQMQADAFGRQFPDLGACGESLLAPTALASSNHLAANGSSLSAAVVSGALTLLLNGRDGKAPPALSVLEAKAIVLATADNANPNGLGDDARGAGFLRTDRLTNEPIVDASYVVKRLTVPNVVTPTGPAPQVASFVVEAGGRYSVALTWLRRAPGAADATAPNWADLDLVLEGPAVPGGSLVARSAVAGTTESNRTWERLEFTAAQSGQVVARARVVRAEVGGTTPAAVHAAVAVVTHERRLPSDPLAGATLVPRPVACVLRTEASVPAAAASLPFGLNFVPRALDGYTQVALPLQVESGAAAPSGEVVELALRGRFFASKVVACELWDGVPYQLGACTILRPHAPLARSRLVVDAAAGVATARFHAAELAAAAGPRRRGTSCSRCRRRCRSTCRRR